MKKAVAFLLCAALCMGLLGSTAVFADSVSYYATITDFTAVYDKYMQKVELDVSTHGFIAEGETFTVEIYCSVLDPYYDQWLDGQTLGLYKLSYGDCLKGGNGLRMAFALSYDVFYNPSYKDFRVVIKGNSVGDSLYLYSMDSRDIPISPKADALGTPVDFDVKITPAATAIGGYSVVKLEIKDIEKNLSGGLTWLNFTLNYNPNTVRLEKAESSANASGWAPVANQGGGIAKFTLMGGGLTENGDLTVKLTFLAVGAGKADLSITDMSGGDGYGHGFKGAAVSLGKDISVTQGTALIGDVNGDGDVDNLDAAYVLKYDARIISHAPNGDVNGDGKTNSLDASLILRFDAGLIKSFN